MSPKLEFLEEYFILKIMSQPIRAGLLLVIAQLVVKPKFSIQKVCQILSLVGRISFSISIG